MKRSILLCLLITLCLLTSCIKTPGKEITKDTLIHYGLTNAPKAECESIFCDNNDFVQHFYGKIEKTAFDQYANNLFNYLKQEHPVYLGYSGKVLSSLFGAMPHYELHLSKTLTDFYLFDSDKQVESYEFVYSLNNKLGSKNTNLLEDRKIIIKYYNIDNDYINDEGEFEFNYNFEIVLTSNAVTYNLNLYEMVRFSNGDVKVDFSDLEIGEVRRTVFTTYEELETFFTQYVDGDINEYLPQELVRGRKILVITRKESSGINLGYKNLNINDQTIELTEVVLSEFADDGVTCYLDFIIIDENKKFTDFSQYDAQTSYNWEIKKEQ